MGVTGSNSDLVRVEQQGGVLTFTLTRDRKFNAVNSVMLSALRSTIERFAEDDAVRVLVIGAEGRYFTAGVDISDMPVGGAGSEQSGMAFRRDYRRLHLLFDELEAIEKPSILAVQGPCLGFGLELGVSCDFRLAAQSATFALPEIRNLAALPGSGGISRLTRLVGPHWARWLAMAGQTMDADQALTAGLVHCVVPDADFGAAVAALATDLAGQSSEALAVAKIAIDASVGLDRASARDVDRLANHALAGSAEHRAKVAGFLDRP